MTTFIESPRFPDDIAYGSVMGFGFLTEVTVLNSGHEQRNVKWADALGRFAVDGANMEEDQKDTFIDFFRIVKGRGIGFRIRDWSDYEATTSNGYLGTSAVGTGGPTYQLYKHYAAGAETYNRLIAKPSATAGEFTPYRGGVAITAGASAGNYSIDTTTGILTMVADASSAASAITPGATTSVTLAANPGTLVAGQKLYLSGFTGANASLVNGLAHTINSVSGAGPYVFVLATDTSGATITVGSGTGYKYPQASESMLWAGNFDVPARFDVDDVALTIVAKSGGGWIYNFGTVPIKEIRV